MAEIELIHEWNDIDVARWVAARLEVALRERSGIVAVAVPGGSTPFPILRKLSRFPLDFERLEFWPSDERNVPEDHHSSNTGRIRASLASSGASIKQIKEGMQTPHFALVWLGMGPDGHVASLFPSSNPRLDDPIMVRHIVPDPLPPEAPFARTSMTLPALLDSDGIIFVFRGSERQSLFKQSMRGENDLPISRLLSETKTRVTAFI